MLYKPRPRTKDIMKFPVSAARNSEGSDPVVANSFQGWIIEGKIPSLHHFIAELGIFTALNRGDLKE
jgi:hypothetical protein